MRSNYLQRVLQLMAIAFFTMFIIILGIVLLQSREIQNKELLLQQLRKDLERDNRVVEIVKTQVGLCSDELFEMTPNEK